MKHKTLITLATCTIILVAGSIGKIEETKEINTVQADQHKEENNN